MKFNQLFSEQIRFVMLWLIIGSAFGCIFSQMRSTELIADEYFHVPYIARIIEGDYTFPKYLTVPPTYHFLIAEIAKVFALKTIASLRMINMIIGLLCILAFYNLVEKTSPESKNLKTFQFAFLPILFPFYFLNYTDVTSLLFVILSTSSAVSGKSFLSGVFGLISLLIRQTNIFWVFFNFILCFIDFFKNKNIGFNKKIVRDFSSYALSGGLFLLFFVLNHGFSLGDKETQKLTLNVSNIWFLIIMFAILFPHDCIPNIWASRKKLVTLKIPVLILLLGFAFWKTYEATCTYNHIPFYLRNLFLLWSTTNVFGKITAALLLLIGFCGMLFQKEKSIILIILLPITIISVVFLPLIEIRYYFICFSLYLAFKKDSNHTTNLLISTIYFVISFYLMIEITKKSFFL